MERGPIFIGGPDRSGKTYMRLMIASHPDIALTKRANMWVLFYERYGDLSRQDNFERCLEAMLHYKHIASLNPDPHRVRREFWQGEASYSRLFALIHQHYAELQGKSRWGDQSELIERYADPIFTGYQGAKIIHLLRDPRDRYKDTSARWKRGKGKAGVSIAKWLYSASLAARNQQRYPDQYIIVRYETMVSRPEETIRGICEFIDENYFLSMLTMENVARFRKGATASTQAGQSPLTTKFIGHYRGMIAQQDVAFIQKYAGRKMEKLGYRLDPVRFSPGEKLRFSLIDMPINLVRMMSWQRLEAIKRKYKLKQKSILSTKMLNQRRDPNPPKIGRI